MSTPRDDGESTGGGRAGSWDVETRAVHAGEPKPLVDGAVTMPIFQSSTYLTGDAGSPEAIRYVRLNNTPNHDATAAKVAALEGTESALLTSSGLGAITAALLSFLEKGDHVIAQDCLYGGTWELLRNRAPKLGIRTTFVSLEDPDAWRRALEPGTRVLYCESVTNPLLDVGRLDAAADFAREHGLVSMIDNTFPSPIGLRPASLGFDLVLHSATKSLGGHSDVVAGVVAGSRENVLRVRSWLDLTGACLDPHACFLLNRGLKTLPLRVRAQWAGATALAEMLAEHPAVEQVRYPGLPDHPSHERASRLLDGPGSMVSFVPSGGVAAAERLESRLRVALVAPSLGGVETLVSRPARTSHVGLSTREREAAGIPDAMVRVSVGIESPADLIADFRSALE